MASDASQPSWLLCSLVFHCLNCFFVALTNIFLGCIILFTQKLLRRSIMIPLAMLALSDSIMAICGGITALERVTAMVSGKQVAEKNVRRWECLMSPLTLGFVLCYFCIPMAEISISLDRFLAVYKPVFYAQIYSRASLYFLIGNLSLTLIFTVFCFAHSLVYADVLISSYCFLDTYTSAVYQFMSTFRSVGFITAIVLYIPIIFKLCQMYGRGLTATATEEQNRLYKLTAKLGLLIFALLFMVVIPDFMVTYNIFGLDRYQQIVFNVALCKPWLTVFAAFSSFPELRQLILNNCIRLAIYGNSRVVSSSMLTV